MYIDENNKKATRESYGEALLELGRKNNNIVALDADLSSATNSKKFAKEFPDRFFNIGIAEADLIGTAVGLSRFGKIPFASTFAVFSAGRAYDQIRQSVAYANSNVKIIGTHSGITVGEDGATHQMLEDISLMRTMPNMKVFSPADDLETKKIIEEISKINSPCYVRLARSKTAGIYNENLEYSKKLENFEIGKGIQLGEGTDATIIATGVTVAESLKAKEILEQKGINIRVIDIHTIKPIDRDVIIKAAKETKKIITVEDHSIIGGLGSSVCEVLAEEYPVKVVRMGIKDEFGRSGKAEELMEKYKIDYNSIVEEVLNN